jgi:hypothetical protein
MFEEIPPMFIKTFCLGAPARETSATALAAAAKQACASVPGLREVLVQRVLRHIPTDSVRDDRSHTGVVAEADRIACVVECGFADMQGANQARDVPAWQSLMQALQVAGEPLFTLDTQSNVPIVPTRGAVDGGFRRWMLLARKAETQEQFRDAWFGRHASLVKALPQVDGYLQNLVTARYDAQGRAAGYEALPIDGVAQLCFADEQAMNSSYASDARLPLRDDGRALLGRITTVLMQGEVYR